MEIKTLFLRSLFLVPFGLAAMVGCQFNLNGGDGPPDRRFVVIAGEAGLYQRPDHLSRKVASLPFGQEVTDLEKRLVDTTQGWKEVRAGKEASGFVRSSALGTPEIIEKLRALMRNVDGAEPQAEGQTTPSTTFRLDPGREGQPIEKLSVRTRFEMFKRQAVLVPREGAEPDKEIWYKVRLADGRVGYIYTKNLKFEPPPELAEYTHSRRTAAWLKLRELQSPDFGGVNEYLVAYATLGVDFEADYNRVEIYTWDGNRYQTAFARSSLKGILPISVIREDEAIHFELREIDPKQPGYVFLRKYRFPHPIKEIGGNTLEEDVGLH